MAYRLTTPHGAVYIIHDNGNIERTDMKFTPSGQWKMLGIEHVRDSVFIPFDQLSKRLPELSLLYKNGHPQWTVRDSDHGSMRTWGNTRHHGIKKLEEIC